MSADLWREFSLLGHWIVDAVVLRWAELTKRFGHRQGIQIGQLLPLLLVPHEPVRATSLARGIFLRHPVQRCVWSDRRVAAKDLAVDHVIPFSLWGSNDLWNLMPTHAGVNCQKSDKLPAAQLLRSRQHKIIEGWQLLREVVPAAFDRQAAHLLGRPPGGPVKWEAALFARLREAIEITALQRGIERWQPTGQPKTENLAIGERAR